MSKAGNYYNELIYNKFKQDSIYFDEQLQDVVERYKIEKNALIQGYKSNTLREVDVAIWKRHSNGEWLFDLECKHWNSKIDITILDAYYGKLEDINAHRGYIFSTKGFTKKAFEYASHLRGIEVRQLTLEDLQEYANFDYNAFASICTCNNKKSPFGFQRNGYVGFHEFVTIYNSGKHFKIYQGNCNECGAFHCTNTICWKPIFLFPIEDEYIISQGAEITPREISCCNKCGLVYKIDRIGNLSYFKNGEECILIARGQSIF